MGYRVIVLPGKQNTEAAAGENLLAALRRAGLAPEALCLGSGGCRLCKSCAYPAPCRFPDRSCASMEGYGLFVTRVCRDCGVPYHHGERTITYTTCILWGKMSPDS